MKEKRGRGRPAKNTEAVCLRLPTEILIAIEETRAKRRPIPTRTDMIAEALASWLMREGAMP